MPQGRLLAVTDAIYQAATGEAPWSTASDQLRRLLRANSISLLLRPPGADTPELLSHAEIPAEAVDAYNRHYRHVDLWTNRAAATFAGALATGVAPPVLASGDMLVPDADFLRSEFWTDFGRRYGLRYVLGTIVPLGAAGTLPIGLHRPQGAAPFGPREKHALEAVLPHLRRGLQLRHRLAPASLPPSTAALDAIAAPLLVLDETLRVQFANAAAEALAARPDSPLQLRRAIGILPPVTIATATRPADRDRLARLVQLTARMGAAGGAMRLAGLDGTTTMAALVSPLPRFLSPTSGPGPGIVPGRALLLLRPLLPLAEAPPAALLRDLFGLTRAEADIARALAGGATKAHVATLRGLRETTVRSHVRAVLEKTGTANLRELERLLAGLLPP